MIAKDRVLLSPQIKLFIILGLIWVVVAIAVNPVGEFPLNDDWSYSRTVYSLVSDGKLQFTGWQSVPLIVQVVWGAAFCKVFGLSFTALRISTLVLGLIGVLSSFVIINDLVGEASIAFVGALVIMFNPLYFELSNTFMTDVPFYCFAAVSFLLLVRATVRGSAFAFVVGCCFAGAATLIRQIGIILPVSFGVAYAVRNGISRRIVFISFLPTLLIGGILFAYQTWLKAEGILPALYNLRNDEILNHILHYPISFMINGAVKASVYLGLFLMPFLIIWTYSNLRKSSPRYRAYYLATLSALSIATTAFFVYKQKIMPLTDNVLFDFGLGPATLRDQFILKLPDLPTAPSIVWVAVTLIGVAGAFMLFHVFFSAISDLGGILFRSGSRTGRNSQFFSFGSRLDGNGQVLLFVILCCLFYMMSLLLIDHLIDRYFVFMLLPIVVIMALSIRKSSKTLHAYAVVASLTLLAIYGAFSIGATHDYLSWNRARWEALRYLMENQHISPRMIDGGFEFNGWYNYDPGYQSSPTKSWWWVIEDDYVVSFGILPGYQEIGYYPYDRWLPPGQGTIFLLHKVEDSGKAKLSNLTRW